MSYTVDELEAACKQFENDFFGGQACDNVRNVLVNVIRGGKRIPKRKAPRSTQKSKKQKFEQFARKSVDKLRNLRKRSFEDARKNAERKSKRRKQNVKGGQDTPETTYMPSPSPTRSVDQKVLPINKVDNESNSNAGPPSYMELLVQANGPQKRAEILQKRVEFQYQFLVPRLFKDGKIRHPLANSFVCLTAWYMVIEDLCETLVTERGVEVLSGGEIKTDIKSVMKGIQQISSIIQQYTFLQECSWPMFNALIEKVFLTYLVIETA